MFSRLHRADTSLVNAKTRPSFLDDKVFVRVGDAMTKAFPRIPADPAKIGGYDQLVAQAQAIHDQLGNAYYALVDTCEWVGAAREVLGDIKSVTCLNYAVNPRVTEAYLDLVQVYMRMLFLMQHITDRQLVLSFFCRAYFHMKYVSEPSFERTAEFVHRYTEVVPSAQADLRNVSNQLADAITTLYMPFASNSDVSALRTKGLHNLTLKPDAMALPNDDQQLYDQMRQHKNYLRIVYGLLPLGEAYAKISPDLVTMVLQEAILTPVYREISIDLSSRYNFMIKNFKPKKGDVPAELLKDLTKVMTAVKKSVDTADKFLEREVLQVHQQRRVYVRQELQNLLNLFRDKPGLVAPKFTVLLSILALARDEIMWLVRHYTGPLPKGSKLKPEDFDDRRLTDLVYLVNQLTTLVRQNAGLIRNYYIEYLSGVDLRLAQKEAGSVTLPPGAKVKSLMDSILAELQTLRVGEEHDFSALRS